MKNRCYRSVAAPSVLLVIAVLLTTPSSLAKQHVVRSTKSAIVTTGARAARSSGGKVLVTSGAKVVLIDRESKAVLWESTGLRFAYCVAAMPGGGGFLIGEGKSISQIDSEGKFVSRASPVFQLTTDVKPLEGGRMLVSDGPAGTVTEMDWSGNISWSIKGLHHPSEANRLENGNTLVADGTAELKEFDSEGKKVRGTLLRQWAASVQRVFGGTLVGESKSVELLDNDGRVVWSRPIPSRVTGVQQLLSGEYLVSEPDAGRVAILDGNGTVIWEVSGLHYPWRAIYLQ